MVNEKNRAQLIHKRAASIIGYREQESIAEARIIKDLINNIQEREERDFLDTPKNIIGLQPQCLSGKIKARLSSYCAHCALFELTKNPFSLSLAEEWIATAETCLESELANPFITSARNSRVASKSRKSDHVDILRYWEKLLSGGASVGDANKRTAEHYNISIKHIQNIRKKQKTKLTG